MVDRIKFHPSTGSGHRLDEHVDPDIARALRRYGIDVTTTVDAGLRTRDDPVHLDFIRREGRVVVTHDADFLRYASQSSDHPGIAYCQMGAHSLSDSDLRGAHTRGDGRPCRGPVIIDNRTQELAPEINNLLTNSIHTLSALRADTCYPSQAMI